MTETKSTAHAYVLREKECRHATIFMVDSEIARKGNSREIAKAMRQGMTVERMTVDAARKLLNVAFEYEHTAKGECKGRVKKASA